MRRIIGDKLYDTAKATRLGPTNTSSVGLYRTPKGAYFIVDFGAAVGGGRPIEVLTRAAAAAWCKHQVAEHPDMLKVLASEFDIKIEDA